MTGQPASLAAVPAFMRRAADELDELLAGAGEPEDQAARFELLVEVSDLIRSANTGRLLGALCLLETATLAHLRRMLAADTSPDRNDGDQQYRNGAVL